MADNETPEATPQDERQSREPQQQQQAESGGRRERGGGGERERNERERGERSERERNERERGERSERERSGSSDRERGDRERGRRRHQQPSQPPARRPETSINIEELREVLELIAAHGLTDFELEREGFRISVGRRTQTEQAGQSSTGATPQQVGQQPAATGSQSSGAPATSASTTTQSSQSHLPPHPGAQAEAAASADEDLQIIKSPIVGTFYRSPSPTAEPFIRMGSFVTADSVVCIIEAMKLMNEIQAELSGEIAKIYVENGQPVEYGQPLFGVKK
jgi:acetyl-CoA carboxylase biotin carboxyl carrier protein